MARLQLLNLALTHHTLKGNKNYDAPGTSSDFCSICLTEDQTGDKPIPIPKFFGKISDALFRISSINNSFK
jgi:hypothetical protein